MLDYFLYFVALLIISLWYYQNFKRMEKRKNEQIQAAVKAIYEMGRIMDLDLVYSPMGWTWRLLMTQHAPELLEKLTTEWEATKKPE